MRLISLTLCTGAVVGANFVTAAAVDAEPQRAIPQSGGVREVTRAFLLDRIHGGWAGMLIGGLEGQPGYRVRLQAPRRISGLESARLPAVFELEPRARSRP